jgi:hypothetical protein
MPVKMGVWNSVSDSIGCTPGRVNTDRRFVLSEGRLIAPYPANTYDMARDGAVEIEKIKITSPPNEGLEGLVQMGFLWGVGPPSF